jgi:hypothetical protein
VTISEIGELFCAELLSLLARVLIDMILVQNWSIKSRSLLNTVRSNFPSILRSNILQVRS